MRNMLFIFFLLISSTVWAKNYCPQNIFINNVLSFEIENQYSIYFDGYQNSCEFKCFQNASCINDCQHKEAVQKTSHYLTEKHGKEILKCLDVQKLIVKNGTKRHFAN